MNDLCFDRTVSMRKLNVLGDSFRLDRRGADGEKLWLCCTVTDLKTQRRVHKLNLLSGTELQC